MRARPSDGSAQEGAQAIDIAVVRCQGGAKARMRLDSLDLSGPLDSLLELGQFRKPYVRGTGRKQRFDGYEKLRWDSVPFRGLTAPCALKREC